MAGWARPVRIAENSSLAYSIALAILVSASRMMSAITVRAPSACGSPGVRAGSGAARSGVDRGTDLLTRADPHDRAVGVEVEEDHGQLVVPGHADGGGVGDLEVPREVVVVGELVEHHR